MYVSLITIENGILGYLYNLNNDNDNEIIAIEDLDGLFFWLFACLWIFGQIYFTIRGLNTRNKEIKKLTMGSEELAKLEEFQTVSKNFNFLLSKIDEKDLNNLNNRKPLTLIAQRKD